MKDAIRNPGLGEGREGDQGRICGWEGYEHRRMWVCKAVLAQEKS